jgi:hypothetical protein
MLLQYKQLHARGGMHVGDPILQFRAYTQQNVLLFPAFLELLGGMRKLWMESFEIPNASESQDTSHPAVGRFGNGKQALAFKCMLPQPHREGETCLQQERVASAQNHRASEATETSRGRAARLADESDMQRQQLLTGPISPLGSVLGAAKEARKGLAGLHAPGTLLAAKLPVPESPSGDVASQLQAIQDALQECRLSDQQFKCAPVWKHSIHAIMEDVLSILEQERLSHRELTSPSKAQPLN